MNDSNSTSCYAGLGLPCDPFVWSLPEPLIPAENGQLPVTTVNTTTEVIATGSPWGEWAWPASSDAQLEQCGRRISPALIGAILRDPTAGSAVRTLKLGVVAGGIKITPAVREGSDNAAPNPDADLAKEIAAFVDRCHARMQRAPLLVIDELLDALTHRHKVGEVVLDDGEGMDAGRYVLARVNVKPQWSYKFVVDTHMNLDSLEVLTGDPAQPWVRVRPDKFVIFSWDTKNGDPRGNTILDSVLEPWELKRSLVPAWKKGVDQFGTPTIVGKTAEGAQPIPQYNPDGSIDRTKPPVSPQVAFSKAISLFVGSGHQITVPFGYELGTLESNRDGTANVVALERCDADMTRAILLQTRMTREARFGSKADSETGADVHGTYVLFLKAWAASLWCDQVVWRLVEINWGKEIADRLTPNVSLGGVNARDFAGWAIAVATLFQSGYFTKGMLPATDAFMGFEPRQPDDERVGPQKDNAAGNGSKANGTPDNPNPPQGNGGNP